MEVIVDITDNIRETVVCGCNYYDFFDKRVTQLMGNPVKEVVVRCKDCKYSRWKAKDCDGNDIYKCLIQRFYEVTPDGFCAWGRTAMTEMEKLEQMLRDANIDYRHMVMPPNEFTHGFDVRNQLQVMWHDGKPWLSAVCQFGSYGGEAGLIECWDFNTDEEPDGWLYAEEAFDYFKDRGMRCV